MYVKLVRLDKLEDDYFDTLSVFIRRSSCTADSRR